MSDRAKVKRVRVHPDSEFVHQYSIPGGSVMDKAEATALAAKINEPVRRRLVIVTPWETVNDDSA